MVHFNELRFSAPGGTDGHAASGSAASSLQDAPARRRLWTRSLQRIRRWPPCQQ
jgi:hypothetical protein